MKCVPAFFLVSVAASPVFSQSSTPTLERLGISVSPSWTLSEYADAARKIESKQYPVGTKTAANVELLTQAGTVYPLIGSAIDHQTGVTSFAYMPKNRFAFDFIEGFAVNNSSAVKWESAPQKYRGIELTPIQTFDFLREYSSNSNISASLLASHGWSSQGLLHSPEIKHVPELHRDQIFRISESSDGPVGVMQIPNPEFFKTYRENANLGRSWLTSLFFAVPTEPTEFGQVNISIGNTAIAASSFDVLYGQSERPILTALTDDGEGAVYLAEGGDSMFEGVIAHDTSHYMVQALPDVSPARPSEKSDGFYSVIQIGRFETAKFEEGEEGEPEIEIGNFGQDQDDFDFGALPLTPQNRIDIAIAYSEEAQAYLDSLEATGILERFGSSNLTKLNVESSRNSVEFVEVAQSVFSFDQNGRYSQILQRSVVEDDEVNRSLREFRDEHKADILVLAIYRDDANYRCGRVQKIAPSPDEAHLIWNIVPNCIFRESLAHEIGHIFGGVHPDHSTHPTKPYAHGFDTVSGSDQCHTIMSRQGSPNPRGGWSDPNGTFQYPSGCRGKPMGTREKHYVARLISENAPVIKEFR